MLNRSFSIKSIQLSLYIFCIVLSITGISLVIIGATINEIYDDFYDFLPLAFISSADILLVLGFTIFVLASFGWLASYRENACLIMMFGTILGLISITQLSVGISNSILMYQIDDHIDGTLNETMSNYYSKTKSQTTMDDLQQELHCCGFSGPTDWKRIYNKSIPESCCYNLMCGTTTFYLGCEFMLKLIINETGRKLTVSAYMLSVSQVFGVLFSFYLARILRKQKLAHAYRQWAIRSQFVNNMAYDPHYDEVRFNEPPPSYANINRS